MKKALFYKTIVISSALLAVGVPAAIAQSMHFSQCYNAPQLLNPANTALMPDYDYRGGAIYRNQWAAVPVPYNTVSAFADFKVAKSETKNNWLGLGAALFNDKAGDGDLSLTQVQISAAYHLSLNEKNMLSLGLSGGLVQRSVNYDELTFDTQWDGVTFNKANSNGEKTGIIKTNYQTIGAGLNYAYIPSENAYIKVGAGVANINQPKETFYDNNNQVSMRSTGNVDVLFRMNESWIMNPSVYYTTQDGASELIFGSLFRMRLNGNEGSNTQLILGAFNRLNESIIGTIGLQWGGLQAMLSYDATISSLAPYNSGYGAFEFSLIYQGAYSKGGHSLSSYNCPRFF
jgi:type IX secretion system PorP/SprF family membrane protein